MCEFGGSSQHLWVAERCETICRSGLYSTLIPRRPSRTSICTSEVLLVAFFISWWYFCRSCEFHIFSNWTRFQLHKDVFAGCHYFTMVRPFVALPARMIVCECDSLTRVFKFYSTSFVRTSRSVLTFGSDLWDILHHSIIFGTNFLSPDPRILCSGRPTFDFDWRKVFQKGKFCDASFPTAVVRMIWIFLGCSNVTLWEKNSH